MSSTGSRDCKYELTYEFEKVVPGDSIEKLVTITTDTNDTKQHRDKAYQHLTRLLGRNKVDNVRKDWVTSSVGVAFANAPWDDESELEEKLTSIQGVQHIRFDGPTVQDWHPARYIVRVDNGRATDVQQEILQYYDGLTPKVDGTHTVIVGVSPLV